MLDIGMKALSIFGMVLLALLFVLLAALVLLLFFPITYKACGDKDAEGLRLSVRVNWLFGLVRVRLRYPEPGRLTAKALCFTLFDRCLLSEKSPGGHEERDDSEESRTPKRDEKIRREAKQEPAVPQKKAEGGASGADEPTFSKSPDAGEGIGGFDDSGEPLAEGGGLGKISQKIQKIKCKITEILDKIKRIWENISYYMELAQEESTKQLASHVAKRTLKILKSIRPRHIRGEVLFGTGAPDTTGYLYGACCAAAAMLGTGFFVTPDFEEKRLEGDFEVSGRIYMCVLFINGLRLILDKQLWAFIKRLKR